MTQTAALNCTMIGSLPVLLAWVPVAGAMVRPVTNLIISNVPGPRETLYFHGAEMVDYHPISQVGHGMALNITVLSYAGQLSFGFVACRDSVPSVQRLRGLRRRGARRARGDVHARAAEGSAGEGECAEEASAPARQVRGAAEVTGR